MPRLARLLASVALTWAVTAVGASIPPMTQAPINFPGVPDGDVAVDSEGNIWVVEAKADRIGRLTPAGTYTTFSSPTAVREIIVGPDGNAWFLDHNYPGKVGRITPDGVITEFALKSSSAATSNIAAGPDGNVWFQDELPDGGDALTRISTADGKMTQFPITFDPTAIGSGADGNLWIAGRENGSSKLIRFSPSSAQSASFPMPTQGGFFGPQLIVGPDGNVWFTYRFFGAGTDSIGRVTPDGKITLYPMPTADASPHALAIGQDMNLWFTETKSRKIGQLIMSTATDSGQATINESEILVNQHLEQMILMPSTPRGSLSAVSEIGVLAEEKCPDQTFLIKYREGNTAGSAHLELEKVTQEKCADLDVKLIRGFDETKKAVVVTTTVTNLGPHVAETVTSILTIFAGGGGNSRDRQHWPTIAKGKSETYTTLSVVEDEIFDAVTFSSTPDPDPKNNRHRAERRSTRSEGLKKILLEDVTSPIEAPKRGK